MDGCKDGHIERLIDSSKFIRESNLSLLRREGNSIDGPVDLVSMTL